MSGVAACIRGVCRKDRHSDFAVFEPAPASIWVKRFNVYKCVGQNAGELADAVRDLMGRYAHLAAPGYVSPKEARRAVSRPD